MPYRKKGKIYKQYNKLNHIIRAAKNIIQTSGITRDLNKKSTKISSRSLAHTLQLL